jgi:hypothetical protein
MPDRKAFTWLGRDWVAESVDGVPRQPLTIETLDGLLVLEAGDVLDATWLARCSDVLRGRGDGSFAGTWERQGETLRPGILDLVPEAFAFWRGPRTRVLMRTEAGRLLLDLFDPNLAGLGEIGYVWTAVTRWGRGHLLPDPLIATEVEERIEADGVVLSYLLARYGGHAPRRLALLGGATAGRGNQLPWYMIGGQLRFTIDEATRTEIAGSLGGRRLLSLGLSRLRKRLLG